MPKHEGREPELNNMENFSSQTLRVQEGNPLIDPSTSNMEFDEEGFLYVELPKSFEWIIEAGLHEDDYQDRVIRITFRDGYLGDLNDEQVASDLDKHLGKLQGIEDVYWEDREYFHITYKPGQDISQLLLNIEQFMTHTASS